MKLYRTIVNETKAEPAAGSAGFIFEFTNKESHCVRPPRVKMIDSIAVIQPRGSLMGGDETNTVLQIVRDQIAAGTRKIILDFSGVTWINSHGMGMLMGCYAAAHHVRGMIGIFGASKKVSDLLSITQVQKLFDQFPSIKGAVQTYRQRKTETAGIS